MSGVSICGLLSALTNIEIVERVNAKLPERDQFDAFGGWYFLKTQRLLREYQRLYPDGHLLSKRRALMGIAGACLLTGAFALSMFRAN